MNAKVLLIGVIVIAALVGVLAKGLFVDPTKIRSPLIDKTAPSFVLREVGTNRTVDIAQFRGKPVVLNFWATWCGPCWEEHPVLVANARLHADKVQFLGVVFQDEESKILRFLSERGSGYPTVVDQAGKTAIAYGVGGVPETFFIDANGAIRAKYSGPLSTAAFDEYLKKVTP